MFGFEQSIAEWRRQMTAGGIKDSEILAELENHLREDMERRIREGASEEQAFREATVQLGTAEQLQLELKKLSKPRARFSRNAVRIGCVGVAIFALMCEGWYLLLADISVAERIAGLILVAAIACYIVLLPRLSRLCPGVAGLALRRGVGKACAVIVPAWVVLLYLNLANVTHFPSGFVLSAVCWTLFVAAVITSMVLTYGTDPEVLNPWTPEVQQSFDAARAEAVGFHHDFIGTEHVLLGLLRVEGGSISKILGRMGVSRESVRAEIEKIVGPDGQASASRKLVYTPRAGRAFRLAIQEAEAGNMDRAGAEHLLLGLIREGSGVAALVLNQLGANIGRAREEILKELAGRKESHE